MPGKQKPLSSNNLPKNWPPHLRYLNTPSYSPTLNAEQRAGLKIKPQDVDSSSIIPQNSPKGPYPTVKITLITDPAHPACGQAGLFAARDLKPGSFIIEYLGVIHPSSTLPIPPPPPPPTGPPSSLSTSLPPTNPAPPFTSPKIPTTSTSAADPHAASDYDLSLDRMLGLAIDAAVSGNEARFINDYRGVGPRPNAEFREVWSEARRERRMGVCVLSVGKGNGKQQQGSKGRERGVRKGEEILVSYGKGFWGARKRNNIDDGTG